MEEQATQEADGQLQDQLILLAASNHDNETLRTLLRKGSASVQDPETGFTPLHAAIAACEDAESTSNGIEKVPVPNGEAEAQTNGATESVIEAAAKTLRLLLQRGAIWNDVDQRNETPGCLALRLGLKELYEIMVDAGVRAEMLLNRLDEYEQLADDEDDESETEEAVDGNVEHVQDEPVETSRETQAIGQETDLAHDEYLQSSLRFQDGRILDDSNNGVMMAWETDLMRRTADRLAPRMGLRILNIGHGMGIIDTFFEETYPSAHHIIEAHPAVIARMRKDGWDTKENVTIHEGRWQDVVPKLIEEDGGLLFDAIYFDTFAEDYKALRNFFSDSVIGLLDDGGKWGFFNGLGADRQICYDVYTKVVEMDLFEAGFDTEWETLPVEKVGDEEWQGVKRRYWALEEYKLPICTFIA